MGFRGRLQHNRKKYHSFGLLTIRLDHAARRNNTIITDSGFYIRTSGELLGGLWWVRGSGIKLLLLRSLDVRRFRDGLGLFMVLGFRL